MSTVILAALTALCVLCYTGQTFFNKLFSGSYPGTAAEATPVFVLIYGVISAAVAFAMNGMRFAPSAVTLLMGAVNGAVLFLFNLGMIQAARRGPYAIQSIVMIFGSIALSLLFAVCFFGDRLTGLQGVGILLMLIAFAALNLGGTKMSGIQKGYYFWLAVLFLANGAYSTMMDAQQRIVPAERNEMIMATFLCSALISLIYLLVLRKGKIAPLFRMGWKAAASAFLSSLCAGFAVVLLMFLLRYIPSYILYTVTNGALMAALTLLSAFLLKEKLQGIALAGIALSVVSIVILGI